MLSSKKSVVVVGRRLRVYLGALLAVGFGTAWASFVPPPPAKVEAAPNVARVAQRVPEVLGATRPISSATAARITPVKQKVATRVAPSVVPKRRVAKRPRVERPFAQPPTVAVVERPFAKPPVAHPPVVKKPPTVETVIATLDKLPVIELPPPVLPPVVVALPPAIELPPVPEPPDVDLPRIPTRSS